MTTPKLTRNQMVCREALLQSQQPVVVLRGKPGVGKSFVLAHLACQRVDSCEELLLRTLFAGDKPRANELFSLHLNECACDEEAENALRGLGDLVKRLRKRRRRCRLVIESSEKLCLPVEKDACAEVWLRESYSNECMQILLASYRESGAKLKLREKLSEQGCSSFKRFHHHCDGNLLRMKNFSVKSFSESREWLNALWSGCIPSFFLAPRDCESVVPLCIRNASMRCLDLRSVDAILDNLVSLDCVRYVDDVDDCVRRTLAETAMLCCSALIRKDYSQLIRCAQCGGVYGIARVDKNGEEYRSCPCTFYNPSRRIQAPRKRRREEGKPLALSPVRGSMVIHCALCSVPLYNRSHILRHVCDKTCQGSLQEKVGKENLPRLKTYPPGPPLHDERMVSKISSFLPRDDGFNTTKKMAMVRKYRRTHRGTCWCPTEAALMTQIVSSKVEGQPLASCGGVTQEDVWASQWNRERHVRLNFS